jgi:hypothetical protein
MTSKYINIHLQLTKEVLQSIGKDNTYVSRYQNIEGVLTDIYQNVQREALGRKTKYIYMINNRNISGQDEKFMAELMKKLAAEFTGCKIEYVETKGYDGSVIEKVIVIDWS